MPLLDPEYNVLPEKLHEALLTSPPTKSDCSSHMITTGGLTLSQTAIERAIDLIIEDLFNELILSAQNYATLLARHQTAPPATALRVLNETGLVLRLKREKELAQQIIDDATAEWLALTPAQRAAIPGLKAAGDQGLNFLNGLIITIDDRLQVIADRRAQTTV